MTVQLCQTRARSRRVAGSSRRSLCAALAMTVPAGALCQPAAFAQAYPVKPIRLTVPFPPSGPADILSRVVAKKLSEGLGQQLLVENRSGAGGTSALEVVAKAVPDGYTLTLGSNSTYSIAPIIYRNLGYEPLKSFAPISLVARSASVIVINPALGANSLAGLIAVLKSQPGKFNFGSNGNGTIPHLAGVLFQTLTDTSLVHVPYKGVAPATNDLIAGQIQLAFVISAGLEQHVRAGKLKVLAVASARRLPQLPEVPTTAEAGLAGFESYTWFGMAAPQGTPGAVIARLNAEVIKSLAAKDVSGVLLNQGFQSEGTTPERFAQYIAEEMQKWAPIVKASGMKLD
ncbi:MAG: tripartite tricarboxylate transporter substrate binding protein [Burkholderiales bacterium]|nr:tripartite tricarboxylate transporter substrate binding protein [Burkholderiales bacterium]